MRLHDNMCECDPSISLKKLKNLAILRVGGSLSFFIADLLMSCAIRDRCCAVFCLVCSEERHAMRDVLIAEEYRGMGELREGITQTSSTYMHILPVSFPAWGFCFGSSLSV